MDNWTKPRVSAGSEKRRRRVAPGKGPEAAPYILRMGRLKKESGPV
jgi:hypothetical protein